jgi:hypothetical protein
MVEVKKNPNAPTPEPINSPRRICIDKGGKWINGACVMPQDETIVTTPQSTTDTFKMSGIDRPAGEHIQPQTQQAIEARRNKLELGVELDKGNSARQAQEANQQEAIRDAEIQRLTDEETPQKRELDPYVNELEQIPIVGEFVSEVFNILTRQIPFKNKIFPSGTGKLNYQPQPEELKTAILTEIEKVEIEAGLTDSEKFGTFAESVKLGQLERFIPGLGEAELPSGNVQNIVKSLRVLKTRVTDIESKIVAGKLTQSQAAERIALIENELQAGESRMKLLIQNSPELKVNSDGVNFIELKVLETRERLQDAKIANVKGATRDPTDLEVLNDLKNAINDENFNIPGLE